MDTLLSVLLAVCAAGLAMAFARLLRGPRLPDRVVALDVLTTIGVTLMALFAILLGQAVLLDVLMVVALVSFIGTIAFATHLERRRTR